MRQVVTGRKRHILVDVLGMLLAVYVQAANISDKAGGKTLLERVKAKGYTRLSLIWADGGYNGNPFKTWVKDLEPIRKIMEVCIASGKMRCTSGLASRV